MPPVGKQRGTESQRQHTLCSFFAAMARVVCAVFATSAQRGPRRYRTEQESAGMDLIALALILGLAALGLAWITFADRI